MTDLVGLIGKVLTVSENGEAGESIYRALGDLLQAELEAEGWSLFCREYSGTAGWVLSGGGLPPPALDTDIADRLLESPAPLPLSPVDGGTGTALCALPFRVREGPAGVYVLASCGGRCPVMAAEGESRALSQALSKTVETHLLLKRDLRQSRELEVLTAFTHRLTGVTGAGDLLAQLRDTLGEYLGASAGRIAVFHPRWEATALPATFLFPETPEVEAGFAGDYEARKSALSEGPGIVPARGAAGERGEKILSLPLKAGDTPFGLITLRLPADGHGVLPPASLLPGDPGGFFEALANEIALRVTNVILHCHAEELVRERQKRLQELWILQETNNALRGTVQLNRILKMILAAATTEMGLGFNRAALFLLNEKTGLLQGMLGVGPDDPVEADRIWSSLDGHAGLSLARQIELHAENQPKRSSFDALVKSIRMPLSTGEGALSQCVFSRSALRVGGPEGTVAPEGELVEKLSMTSFAATPIISMDRVFGVMIVDNIFDGKPITDEDLRLLSLFAGQAGLAIANAKDHRAHQRAAEELRIARDQLVQTERLALLGEMAAGLAHEIRNPLVTIGGFARRLQKKLPLRDPNFKYAGIISGEVQRLEQFLEEVLLFGRDRQPTKGPVEINDVIVDMVRLFSANFTEGEIEVETRLSPDLPPVHGDANQFRQIFINLFSNAVDVMPSGGGLILLSRYDQGPPAVISIVVTDTGGGVEPEVLSNLFNPFYTTKSGGHGLGLALTQRIVADHSGRITVKNHPGRGLTFTITLPLAPPPAAEGGPEAANTERRRESDENHPGH